MLALTGNSANAEVVARGRVDMVCSLRLPDEGPLSHKITQAQATRTKHFNKGNINLSPFLGDGLVGDGKKSATPLTCAQSVSHYNRPT